VEVAFPATRPPVHSGEFGGSLLDKNESAHQNPFGPILSIEEQSTKWVAFHSSDIAEDFNLGGRAATSPLISELCVHSTTIELMPSTSS
jgi:hypothetical protein